MSLNGLDAPQVQEAYQTVVADAGGWFLLKYTSRDAVDLLARGKNGVAEARNAIQGYTEASPLYGLIIYRRRKILIKYLPEGTSRLLQARTTVHLGDVLERFSPYETLLEIASSDALNDTSLASSFQLHTASPSPSASRLDEIREDGEDSGPAAGQLSGAKSPSGSMSAAQKYKAERRLDQLKRKAERAQRSTSPLRVGESSPALPPDTVLPPKTKPSMSQYLVHEEQGQTSVTRLESPLSTRSMTEDGVSTASTRSEDSTLKDTASQTTIDAGEYSSALQTPNSPKDSQPRFSKAVDSFDSGLPGLSSSDASIMGDQPGKQSLDDPYDLSKYDEWFKPKVKLGPRPVNPSENKNRPATARVSALPANFKPAAKKQEPARPSSQMPKDAAPVSAATVPPPAAAPPLNSFNYSPPPIPEVPEYDPRPVSRGSVKSTPSHKSTMMTPDKLRLMKAIEHRKRQLRKSRDQQFMKPPTPEDVPDVPEVPTQDAHHDGQNGVETLAAPANENGSQPQSTKADSGIELHYERVEQHQEQSLGGLSKEPRNLHLGPGKSAPSQDPTGESALPPNGNAHHEQHASTTAVQPQEPLAEKSQIIEDQAVVDKHKTTAGIASEAVIVPTIVMADGSRPMTSGNPEQNAQDATTSGADEEEEGQEQSSNNTLEAPTSPKRQNSDLAKRRRGFVEPLQLEVNSGNPDDFASDDDEFLDELHEAEVQEAKPIMVARSPINGSFPDRRPSADTLASVRSVNITRSAQSDKSSITPDRVSPEPVKSPVSATAISPPSTAISPTLEKNESIQARNVSSGISKRIQLLTEMTNREVAQSINLQSRPLTPEYSPNAFLQQDQRGRKSAAPRPRPTSFRRQSTNRSAQSTATPTPTNENAPTWSVQHDPATNRNSVSVTARIIRPSAVDEANHERDVSPAASEITINQRRDSAADELPPLNTAIASSSASSPAMSPAESRASADVRTLHSATSRFGRHRQNSSPAVEDFPPPPKAHSSAASMDESTTSKEGGKTSRFFKRLSNFGGPKRKGHSQSGPNIASTPSVVTMTGPEPTNGPNKASQRMSVAPDTPPAVVVGDLNVQFPDSLLWKRRIVTIDEFGHLQFAIAHAMEIHKGVAQKRYPLADFCAPYAPDLDSQELAHSVVLELHDGTALQAACEDAMTQRQVLHLLRTYWKAWTVIA